MTDTTVQFMEPDTGREVEFDVINAEPAELEPSKASTPSRFVQIVRQYATLTDLMRIGGALAVALAIGLYLVDGFSTTNSIFRFFTLLGFSGALTTMGLVMSHWVRENRGSRVFIGLGLISTPACFTVLGALVYSVMPWDAGLMEHYPGFAKWSLSGSAQLPLAFAAGGVVLTMVTWIGHTVMARSERRWLTISLMITCSFLLIPLRHELWSALLSASSLGFAVWIWRKCSRDSISLKTPAGRFAVSLLFLPGAIIAVRCLMLYDISGVILLTFTSLFYICLRQIMQPRDEDDLLSAVLTTGASILLLCISASLASVLSHSMPEQWAVLMGVIALFVASIDLRRISPSNKLSNGLSAMHSMIAMGVLLLLALWDQTLYMDGIYAAIMLLFSVYYYTQRASVLKTLGFGGVAMIAALNIVDVWHLMSSTGWFGIAAVGALAIVGGSLIDRRNTLVEEKLEEAGTA